MKWYDDNGLIIRWVIGLTLVLAALYGCVRIATYRQDVNARVVSIGWDTKYDVLQYQTVHEGDWYVPAGGRETTSYIKQSGTRRVPNGTERVCYGSGKDKRCHNETKYRYDPVYDRWYEYDIDKWVHIAPLTNAGTTHDWSMPDTTDQVWYTEGTAPQIADRRLSTGYTHFHVLFISNGKQYDVDMVESMWKTFDIENSAILTLDFFNNVTAVKKHDWS